MAISPSAEPGAASAEEIPQDRAIAALQNHLVDRRRENLTNRLSGETERPNSTSPTKDLTDR